MSTIPSMRADSWGTRLQLTMTSRPFANVPADLSQYVAVFHDWIKRRAVDELLIDVTTYEHVPGGPGALLIGHEFDYGLRTEGGRLLLTCRHKRDPSAEGHALRRCLNRLLRAALLLEGDPSLSETPRFQTNEFIFHSNDRLQHPSDATSTQELTTKLRRAFDAFLGCADCVASNIGAPSERLTVRFHKE